MDSFSNRLKKAMELRNIKSSELSEKANIPKSAISQYLSGQYEAKQKSIFKLAKALNVSESWLMGLDTPMDRELRNSLVHSLDLSGLSDDDIEYLKKQIEYLRYKNNKSDKT